MIRDLEDGRFFLEEKDYGLFFSTNIIYSRYEFERMENCSKFWI